MSKPAALLALILGIGPRAAWAQDCPAPPPPPPAIVSTNIYGSGGLGAAPEPRAGAERARLTADLNRFASLLADAAAQGQPAAADCALAALLLWAEADALGGPLANEAARKELIWNSAGLPLAYWQLRQLRPGAELDGQARIEAWLDGLRRRMRDGQAGTRVADNVHAWAALGLAAGAQLASGDEAAARWAEAESWRRRVLAGVDAEGWLRPELRRGRRALAYHQFALLPLLAQEALARRAGQPLDPATQAALRRLVQRTDAAERDPGALTPLAGADQDPGNPRSARSWRWLAQCLKLLPADLPWQPVPRERWLGGSLAGLCRPGG